MPRDRPETSRLPAQRHLGEQRPAIVENVMRQRNILVRIDAIEAARQHRNRARAKARAMRCRIDSPRQPGNHGIAALAKIPCQEPRHLDAGGGGIACPHNAHRPLPVQPAPAGQGDQRRRTCNMQQVGGIFGFALRHQPRTVADEARNFVFGASQSDRLHRPAGLATQRGQRLKRRLG